MNVKDVIGLVLSLVILTILLPCTEVKSVCYKNGILVKVKWIDGSISKLKKGVWIRK